MPGIETNMREIKNIEVIIKKIIIFLLYLKKILITEYSREMHTMKFLLQIYFKREGFFPLFFS